MMGHSHAMSGVFGWVALAPFVAHTQNVQMSPATVAAGAVICGGAALLPDLDHPSSTIARFFGPISQTFSHGVAFVSGGHRKGTHSLLFVALIAGLTYGITYKFGPVAGIPLILIMSGLAFRALNFAPKGTGFKSWGVILVQALIFTALTLIFADTPPLQTWLTSAIAGGTMLHLVGDALTPQGVPFFWPFKLRIKLPIIRETGNPFETKIFTPLMGVGVVVLMVREIFPNLFTF
jgi:membrane-bound metal-dependent hydrolase YbcI (DUF457 family)